MRRCLLFLVCCLLSQTFLGCAREQRESERVSIIVASQPPDAVVWLDGVNTGEKTPAILEVNKRQKPSHLEVRKDGYLTQAKILQTWYMFGSRSEQNDFILPLLGSGLRLQCFPSTAAVLIDGKPVPLQVLNAENPKDGFLVEHALPPGEHTLTVKAKSFPDWESSFTLLPDSWKTLQVDVPLTFQQIVSLKNETQHAEALKMLSASGAKEAMVCSDASLGSATLSGVLLEIFSPNATLHLANPRQADRKFFLLNLSVNGVSTDQLFLQQETLNVNVVNGQPTTLPRPFLNWYMRGSSHSNVNGHQTSIQEYSTTWFHVEHLLTDLPAGEHTLTLECPQLKLDRIERKVRVVPGKVKILRIEYE